MSITLIRNSPPLTSQPWLPYRDNRPLMFRSKFNIVRHVTHLGSAHLIVTDVRIKPHVAPSQSKLHATGIEVVWVSPNDWYNGPRFGSVSFNIAWESLYPPYRAYWIEARPYRIPACSFLLTTNDYTHVPLLTPYDPRIDDGPWHFDEATGIHYRNASVHLEFAIDGNIGLAHADISFVSHHGEQCQVDGKTCAECSISGTTAEARFAAGLLLSPVPLPSKLNDILMSRWRPTLADHVVEPWMLGTDLPWSALKSTDAVAVDVLREVLHGVATDDRELFRAAAHCFESKFALRGSVFRHAATLRRSR